MKQLTVKHSDLGKINYSVYPSKDEAINEYIKERLEESGFDFEKEIRIMGNLNWSEYVLFYQSDIESQVTEGPAYS